MPADLAQELGAREGQDVPGPAGSEGRYQGAGADLRDAEELLGSVAGVSSSRSSFSSCSMASGIASSQPSPASTAATCEPMAGIASQHASRADVGRPRRSRSRAPGSLLRLHYYSWRVGETGAKNERRHRAAE